MTKEEPYKQRELRDLPGVVLTPRRIDFEELMIVLESAGLTIGTSERPLQPTKAVTLWSLFKTESYVAAGVDSQGKRGIGGTSFLPEGTPEWTLPEFYHEQGLSRGEVGTIKVRHTQESLRFPDS